VTRLIIWRHGQTSWNMANRFQGQEDVPLDDVGRAQAAAAAELLAAEAPDAIVTSDLRRTTQTAAALEGVSGLQPHPDVRLRERYFGQWQGLLRGEVEEKFPEEFARWTKGDPAPGADIEPLEQVASRVAAGFGDALERAAGGTVVAVTHGAAARYGIARLLGWSYEQASKFWVLGNCRWAELAHDAKSGWALRAYNNGVPRPGRLT
jgi:glucosyl-3-phosphoglycerate phosphatase